MNAAERCPCGTDMSYDECCGPLHRGEQKARGAEELMLARYSAFVKGEIDFIIETSHPDRRQDLKREDIESWSKNSTWHGLEMLEAIDGDPGDDQGIVEFIARYTNEDGEEIEHHEKALFQWHQGQWFFVDGAPARQDPYVRDEAKVGRNDPCPCGSGRKFKKCCGKAAQATAP